MPIKYDKTVSGPLVVPSTHRDLLDGAVVVGLITVMPDGQPQATPVWADYDGTYVRVNTARGRQKEKNMKLGAKVTILAIDPQNADRWLEIRGQIAVETEDGAVEHINSLSAKYGGDPDFFSTKEDQRGIEIRVTYKIEPTRINTNA
ncbi:MAG: PPOX class F420-dependent oxidoreductase [Anaerolineae bacterium]|nr:PPOX class F420-dependent oxidoreductase [Anaerolineae bacterium]